jgi:hypothetical protein
VEKKRSWRDRLDYAYAGLFVWATASVFWWQAVSQPSPGVGTRIALLSAAPVILVGAAALSSSWRMAQLIGGATLWCAAALAWVLSEHPSDWNGRLGAWVLVIVPLAFVLAPLCLARWELAVTVASLVGLVVWSVVTAFIGGGVFLVPALSLVSFAATHFHRRPNLSS